MADPSERHSLVGPGKLWEMKRAFQIHFLQSVGLTSDQYLLDLGCGTLRGGIPIIKYLERVTITALKLVSTSFEKGNKNL
jgi:cyclopropane fatty-acyl-phospholipid synthase-like methyltransferase